MLSSIAWEARMRIARAAYGFTLAARDVMIRAEFVYACSALLTGCGSSSVAERQLPKYKK